MFNLKVMNHPLSNKIKALSAATGMPADLGQTPEGLGYRQPGYVNRDAYVTDAIEPVMNLAYYGDWDSNEIYIIDVDTMSIETVVDVGVGLFSLVAPYGIDQQGPDKAYALTRLTESLTIVDNSSLTNAGIIPPGPSPTFDQL